MRNRRRGWALLIRLIVSACAGAALVRLAACAPRTTEPAGAVPTASPAAGEPTTPAAAPTTTRPPGQLVFETTCDPSYGPGQRATWWGQDSPQVRSPDAQRVAYTTNPDGDAKLHILRADGGGEAVIDAPQKAFPLGIPAWSPDGRWLAVASLYLSQPAGGAIYVVAADGTGLAPVATYVGSHDRLAWSPDGTQIAFTSGEVVGQGSGTQVRGYHVYVVGVQAALLGTGSAGEAQPVAEGCEPVWLP